MGQNSNEEVLSKVFEEAGISEGTTVNFVRGERRKILNFTPFSTYYNDSKGEDYSHEEKAYILDEKGKILCQVMGGYSSRYSDGSRNSENGESVEDALNRLGEKASFAKYVLVEGRDEKQNNTIIVSRSKYHECRGRITRNDKKLTLYEL